MLLLPDYLPWVVLDTESSGLHADDGARVSCVALAHEYEDGITWSLALPFDQGERDKFPNPQLGFSLFGEEADPNLSLEDWQQLLDWLPQQHLVFHNAKHDLHQVRVGTREWEGRDLLGSLHWDTMLAQRVLDPVEQVGLDITLRRLGLGAKVGADGMKDWLKAHKFPAHRYDLVPWDIARGYVLNDAEMTATLYRHQEGRLHTGGGEQREMIQRELDLLVALYRMEERGIPFDAETSVRAAEELERRADELERTMPFKCSPKESHAYFFGKLGLTADRLTKGGKPSLDEEQVRQWAKDGVPFAREYAEVTKCRRAVSMWYRGYPEKLGTDGRLRTSFKQTRVKSGRMSVQRVQLQAMPKSDKLLAGMPDVRKLVRVENGSTGLWNIDLQQAELRIASRYSRCMQMLKMLHEGVDMHGYTCQNVLHVEKSHPDWKNRRDIAKRLNFSAIFMIGPKHFMEILSKMADILLSEDEARDYVYGWRRLYPEFEEKYKHSQRLAEQQGWVPQLPHSPYEERSYFGPLDFSNTAWNRVVQGSLALFFKMWMIWTEQNHPGHMLLTVHDSLLLEFPLDEGDQRCERIGAWAVEMASNIFDTEMKVDIGRW